MATAPLPGRAHSHPPLLLALALSVVGAAGAVALAVSGQASGGVIIRVLVGPIILAGLVFLIIYMRKATAPVTPAAIAGVDSPAPQQPGPGPGANVSRQEWVAITLCQVCSGTAWVTAAARTLKTGQVAMLIIGAALVATIGAFLALSRLWGAR